MRRQKKGKRKTANPDKREGSFRKKRGSIMKKANQKKGYCKKKGGILEGLLGDIRKRTKNPGEKTEQKTAQARNRKALENHVETEQ